MGFDVVNLAVDSPAVETVGTISLVLVFFTDAIKINLGQLRSNWLLPALALGPGAILTIVLIAFAGAGRVRSLMDAHVPDRGDPGLDRRGPAARCASTTATFPRAVRHTLSVEAGTNDVIVLPLLLVLISLATGEENSARDWVEFAASLYLLGPLIGVGVAFVAIKALSWLRRGTLIRRDYESIYSIGVAFVAFAAAQIVGDGGLIAAFAAGLTIALIDEELCDCFLEYGETTAEMAMLLTFVFLGGH